MNAAEQSQKVGEFVEAALGGDERVEAVVGQCTLGKVSPLKAMNFAGQMEINLNVCGVALTDRRIQLVKLKLTWFSIWRPPTELAWSLPRDGVRGAFRPGVVSGLLSLIPPDGAEPIVFTVPKPSTSRAESIVASLNAAASAPDAAAAQNA